MANPVTAAEATQARTALDALLDQLAADLLLTLLLLDQNDPKTYPAWLEAAREVILAYADAAAELAAEIYAEARENAGLEGRLPDVADLIADRVDHTLRWATTGWSRGDLDTDRLAERVVAGASKLVEDTARHTIADATFTDDRSIGWARVAQPDACAWCALLATRAVGDFGHRTLYSSREAALFSSNPKRASEKYHDNCRCWTVPVFRGQLYEAPDYVQRWEALYVASTGTYSGKDKIKAFRNAYEGREPPKR